MLDKSKLNLYTRRILSLINENIIVTEKVLNCVDKLLTRFIKIMVRRSSNLVQNVKKHTITIPDLEASVKLEFPNCFAEKILLELAAAHSNLPEEPIIPPTKIKLKMKKYAEISRISKTAVHFFACVIEEMVKEIMNASVKVMLKRNEFEMQLEHVFHAFHQQKSFLVLLE
jgi:histone H3/H4